MSDYTPVEHAWMIDAVEFYLDQRSWMPGGTQQAGYMRLLEKLRATEPSLVGDLRAEGAHHVHAAMVAQAYHRYETDPRPLTDEVRANVIRDLCEAGVESAQAGFLVVKLECALRAYEPRP